MFDAYADIFDRRGAAYHAGMTRFPRARDEEFANILALADVRDGHAVLDVPSGGAYLASYLSRTVRVTCVETSRAFASRAPASPNVTNVLCELHETGLPAASFDRVISLAGLHHVDGKPRFFAEAHRVLKPGGLFCVADAAHGSRTARFLDGFVHDHNSMGHRGEYLSAVTRTHLADAGLTILCDEPRAYHWNFEGTDAMTTFCSMLFGIDRATPEQIRDGIREHLGYEETPGRVHMNWELTFLLCRK